MDNTRFQDAGLQRPQLNTARKGRFNALQRLRNTIQGAPAPDRTVR